jgi:hypothetical protein
MDNQHKLIKGYRDLSEAEINAMNAVKTIGEHLGSLVDDLRSNSSLDQRWVSIAETHLQQGVMAAIRSIAQPTTF